MKTKVYIDFRCDRVYSSYYIKGLCQVFGSQNVIYTLKYFREVDMTKLIPSDDPAGGEDPRMLLFVVKNGNRIRKFVVDYNDKTYIRDKMYEWCDVYAKINFEKDKLPEKYKAKILSIPPGTATPAHGYCRTVLNALHSTIVLFLLRRKILKKPLPFLKECVSARFKRINMSELENASPAVRPFYLFFISSLWKYRNHPQYDAYIDAVNDGRLIYLDAVSSMDSVCFEGGLWSVEKPLYNSSGKNISYSTRYSYRDYINKSKQSVCVCNLPAVWGCHGWKMCEFLAMGKAIISMPMKNELPSPLIDGETVYFVHNEAEIKEAVERIMNDESFRKKLEKGARDYYHRWCAPDSVIKLITG